MLPMISASKRRTVTASLPVVSVGATLAVSQLELGWTATHHEANSDFTSTTKPILNAVASTGNQHMLGFGSVISTASANGTAGYDFTSLDQRMGYSSASPSSAAACQALGWFSGLPTGELTITFCGCRPYQRVDPAGTYTANPLGTPTSTELTSQSAYQPPWIDLSDSASGHFGKAYLFAADCAAIAARYPQVKYFQVWNELKNFYSSSLGRWWQEGYTQLFNMVAAAVHAVRPDAKLIGPYPVFSSYSWDQPSRWANGAGGRGTLQGAWGYADSQILDVFTYFLANQVGCDIISYDLRNNSKDYEAADYKPLLSSASKTWPYSTSYYWPTDPWDSSQKIRDYNTWLRARTSLPIWINEWYANPLKEVDLIPGDGITVSSSQEQLSVIMRNLFAAIESGVTGLLFWRPSSEAATDDANPLALWVHDTQAPTILVDPLTFIKANFSAGTQLYAVTSGHADVFGIASLTKLVLVNRSSSAVSVLADGQIVNLAGYGVQLVTR